MIDARQLPIISVKGAPYFLHGDGTTDEHTGAQAAHDASASRIIVFPAGTYNLGSVGHIIRRDNVIIRGEGMHNTIFKGTSGTLFSTSSSSKCQNVTFEDVGFELSSSQTNSGISANGNNARNLTFRRCRWYLNGNTGYGLSIQRGVHVRVDDCLFEGNASLGGVSGRAIQILEGGHDIRIRNTRFLWCRNGIAITTGATAYPTDSEALEYLEVSGCFFDGGWWLLPYVFSGSGENVSYTSTVLTDSGASFSGIGTTSGNEQNVRLMPELESGTLGSADLTEVQDSSATFVTNSVRKGCIVRSGTAFAVVAGVQSETVLRVEGWMDDTTRLPVLPPASGASYTVYGIIIGRISASTSTTLTVGRWHDLDGETVTPDAETRYEVMPKRLQYSGLLAEYGVKRAKIVNNTFLRSWSDQVNLGCGNLIFTGNVVCDGQDMGVTALGDHCIFANNYFERSGAGGLWLVGSDCVVEGNQFVGPFTTQNSANTTFLGAIIVYGLSTNNADPAKANVIAHNRIDNRSGDASSSRYGISLVNAGVAPTDNTLIGNKVDGVGTSGINFYGTHSGTRLRDNDATIGHQNSAVGGDYGTLVGTGTPESAVTAGVGTIFRRTDGGSNTTLYVKESGTGNTGWVAK